jgi:hypothetical protein
MKPKSPVPLSDLFYQMSLEWSQPYRKVLDSFIAIAPEYTDELLEFAILLALDDLDDVGTVGIEPTTLRV